jgi:hypothetical protein
VALAADRPRAGARATLGVVRRVWIVSAFVLAMVLAGCEGVLVLPDGGGVDARAFDGGALDASPIDARGVDGGERDAGGVDAASVDPCAVPLPETPARVLFVGNSFTFTSNMPGTFRRLVEASGFATPVVEMRALGGQALAFHRADTASDGAPARVREGWDVVVLQELSTRPTDALGDPEQFKDDATWFHDLAIESEPRAQVVLYETFARAAGHAYYPGTFDDPADMQAQLRFHSLDCAERYIPENTTVVMERPVVVARVGDAWERVLEGSAPLRLHGDDDYHPNDQGAYLTALVFFGTIYGRSTIGLPALGLDASVALALQEAADATTGASEPVPAIACPRALPVGDVLPIDFGPNAVAGWATVDEIRETVGPLTSADGMLTDARVSVSGFVGTQTGGSATNDLGLPADVSADSLWVGSFDGHDAALALGAEITIAGLVPGRYRLELFASRDGDDAGNGRLTRYAIAERTLDLEVSDNRARAASFDDVSPDASGAITVDVTVSPSGRARFAYAGSLRVTRTR